MNFLSSNEIYSILSLVSLFTAITAILLNIYSRKKDREYDLENRKAQLDMFREAYERKIYNINDKICNNNERFYDINHLLIDAQNNVVSNSKYRSQLQLSEFLKSNGVTDKDLLVKKNQVFILTPFHEMFDSTYKLIYDICKYVGLEALRGDETNINGNILSHIIRNICRSRLVIANIEGRNPNVFYELGIAHALDKPTIILSKSLENVPVDVRSNRIIIYQSRNELTKRLEIELTKALV